MFDLPYWFDLDVRHCIDVMHVKKNVCDNVIDTLLSIQGKTKDDLNTHQDLAKHTMNYDDCLNGQRDSFGQWQVQDSQEMTSVFISVH